MSSTLLAWCTRAPARARPPLRQARRPTPATPVVLIRRALYPANVRNKPSPTGTWRPDVRQTLQRHPLRAGAPHHRARVAPPPPPRAPAPRRARAQVRVHAQAMDELRGIDFKLYMEANKVEDPRARSQKEMEMMKQLPALEARAFDARIRGLFPREMKIPADTPSKTGWDYNWKPIERPL
ncbi:hypothetical protein B0H14DRAFT_2996081 [Mycena olivaceomarginata]|nr:hypothetical protein B0H14DRAFT_2996081 [Mycena olivaceomarginata]